jgi:hypothetical protein
MPVSQKHNQIPCDLGPTQLVAVSSLKFPKTYKAYPIATVKKAARFIETFGLRVPVLVDANRSIVSGEIWALAHKHLELPEISVLFAEGLSPDQLNAYRLGMQRIPELGDWNNDVLAELFQDWTSRDLSFEIELTGFIAPEIDALIGAIGTKPTASETEDAIQSADVGPAVTRLGDVWQCGTHRILCGSSTDDGSFRTLFGKEKAAAVVTDPPYNVAVDGHVGGKASHRNNVQLGRFGRNRSNVWAYAGANGFDGRKTDEGHLLALHPTVRPRFRATRLLRIRSTSAATRASLSSLTPGDDMDTAAVNEAIKLCLSEIHSRLSRAAQIAKAAEACASAGSISEAVTVSMDIEQLIYEAGRLQDAASLMNRLSQD